MNVDEFIFEINLGRPRSGGLPRQYFVDLRIEIVEWCKANLQYTYIPIDLDGDFVYRFRRKEDAAMFMLRWGNHDYLSK